MRWAHQAEIAGHCSTVQDGAALQALGAHRAEHALGKLLQAVLRARPLAVAGAHVRQFNEPLDERDDVI